MYSVKNFSDNKSVHTIDLLGPFCVYEFGNSFNAAGEKQVVCDTSKGIKIRSSAMQWIAGPVEMVSNFLLKKPSYIGSGMLAMEPTEKNIVLLRLSDWNNNFFIQDDAFLACDESVVFSDSSKLVGSNISDLGRYNLLTGSGVVCLESDCAVDNLISITLDNDVLKVDGNMVLAYSGSLELSVEKITKSIIGSASSGEGYLNVYRGTGEILMSPIKGCGYICKIPTTSTL